MQQPVPLMKQESRFLLTTIVNERGKEEQEREMI